MGKEKISVTLEETQAKQLAEMVGNQYENRSEAVRDLLEKGMHYDEIETERDTLRRRLGRTDRRIADIEDVLEYVRREREREAARARRRQLLRDASIPQRVKWKLLGMPTPSARSTTAQSSGRSSSK